MCNKTWRCSRSRCDINVNLLQGDVHKEHFARENSCDVQYIPPIKACVKMCDLWVLGNAELGLSGLLSKSCRNVESIINCSAQNHPGGWRWGFSENLGDFSWDSKVLSTKMTGNTDLRLALI